MTSIIEETIRELHAAGKTARAIATELYHRGMTNMAGNFLTADMVEGILRYSEISPHAKAPAVLPPSNAVETLGRQPPPHVTEVESPSFRGAQRREWPPGVNYGGDNSYPLYEPPYNFTHQPCGYSTGLQGASSAYAAFEFGGCGS